MSTGNDSQRARNTKRRLTRRGFIKVVGGIASGLALSACAPQATPPTATGPTAKPAATATTAVVSKPVEVRYWGNPIPEYSGSRLNERIAKFEAEHPGIKVIYEPYPEDGHTKFLAQAVAGTAPDIIENGGGNYRRLYQAGVALNLQPFMSDLPKPYLDEWPPAFLKWLEAPDGAIYGLPMRTWHMVLIYNKDMFDEVKVPYPDDSWDHDDYLEAMQKFIKEEGGKKVRWGGHEIVKAADWLENKLRVFDGYLVDPQDDTRCALGDKPAQEALAWIYKAIWETNAWAQTSQIPDYWFAPFDVGALATMASGSWIISILDGSIEDRFRWDFAPYPKGPQGTRASFASSDCWTVYAGTKNPEATWEVLKWLVSDEMEIHMMESAGSEPSRASLYPKWKEIVRSRFPRLAEANLDAFEEPAKENYVFFSGLFKDQAKADEILNPALEAFIDAGTTKPEDFVAIADEITQAQRG
jgi:multiple sugar transport system substrate-binding protein